MSVSNVPGHGRIRRGPMAADVLGNQFTQVWNRAVRDQRLSRRARGLLVELLSHRDGFGISIPSLVAAGPEGRDAIRAALTELERYGYLHRVQSRDERGRLAESVYEITDMPEGLALEAPAPWREDADGAPAAQRTQNCRSDPSPGKPTTAEPTTANPPHKKITSSKKTSRKKTLSPPPSPEAPSEPVPVVERETMAAPSPTTTAQRVVRSAGIVAPQDEKSFIDWAEAQHRVAGGGWWRRVAANGDLPGIVATWQAQRAPQGRTGGSLPPWCGQCGDGMPAEFNPRFRVRDGAVCPDCHPAAAAA